MTARRRSTTRPTGSPTTRPTTGPTTGPTSPPTTRLSCRKLEVLHVPYCPNLLPLLERLAEVTDLPVSTHVIESEADAARFGMAGSPTLLVDGIDPFAAAGGCECGLACRLYRDDAGRIISAPSVEQLRVALAAVPLS